MLSSVYEKLEKKHNTSHFLLDYRLVKITVNCVYPLLFRFQRGKHQYKDTSNVIVSLTSFPARIKKVYLTIYSILKQTIKPKKIILYLSKKQFDEIDNLPSTLKKIAKDELVEIRFVDGDIRSHKKYYYAVEEYPDHPILTIDDDIIYPENLIEVLLNTAGKWPGAVCCTHAHKVIISDNHLAPYSVWDQETQEVDTVQAGIVPIGCGGVLYPPHCFDGTEVLEMSKFLSICPLADDLWLKCHSLLNGHEAVKSGYYPYWVFSDIIILRNKSLTTENVRKNQNDVQINSLLENYPLFNSKILV